MTLRKDILRIDRDQTVILLRKKVEEYCDWIGMGLLNQTKLMTAASELARNMIRYGGGGKVILEIIKESQQIGVRLTFADKGPGITNISQAMKDGYSTGKSLGIGLPGSKRLVNEFSIDSKINEGTTVIIVNWKNG